MKRSPILPPTYLGAAIATMVALHLLFPVKRVIPFPWNLLGLLSLALGVVLNIMADRDLRDAKTTVKPFQESEALVMTGAYRASRNPMYLGFVLILLGLAILLGSLSPFLAIPVFAVVMDRVFIVAEEGMLAAQFEGAWQDYKATVRRWL